ncbi:MAG: ABC transporter permease [Planctomycetes bacterium]|nr:ABC transporter permease [Planctomycetota bacterium]
MVNRTRFLAVAWKEMLQLRRDKLSFAMIVGIPLMQLLLFGYAINTDVRHIPLAVVDEDETAASRDLARSLAACGTFDVVARLASRREIEPWIRASRAQAALVVPAGWENDLARGRSVAAQFIVDGSDPQVIDAALPAVTGFFAARNAAVVAGRLLPGAAGAGGAPAVRFEPAVWYNPELRSAVFIVPGLIGLILTLTLMVFTAMAVVRERERGTLEQLIASPVTRLELITGKIAPYILIGYVQISLVLAVGHFVFRTPFVGSILLLYVLAFAFIGANLSLGMTISTFVNTQQQALQMAFFFFLPNVLLSGFIFPFQAMPRPAQVLGNCVPLTHFLRIVRGIVLRGAETADILPHLGYLLVIFAVLVTVATLRFKKRID